MFMVGTHFHLSQECFVVFLAFHIRNDLCLEVDKASSQTCRANDIVFIRSILIHLTLLNHHELSVTKNTLLYYGSDQTLRKRLLDEEEPVSKIL